MGPTKYERLHRQSKFTRKQRTRFGAGIDNLRAKRKSRHTEVRTAIEESLKRAEEQLDG